MLQSGNIQRCCKDDVSLDGSRGGFHLLHQSCVAHHFARIPELPASLIKANDCTHYGALQNVRQLADVLEWHSLGPMVYHLQSREGAL